MHVFEHFAFFRESALKIEINLYIDLFKTSEQIVKSSTQLNKKSC